MEKSIEIELNDEQISTLFKVEKCSENTFYRSLGKEGGYGVEYYGKVLYRNTGKDISARDIKDFLKGESCGSLQNIFKTSVWDENMEKKYNYHQPFGIRGEMEITYNIETKVLDLNIRFWDID